jgi:hypothetical protein
MPADTFSGCKRAIKTLSFLKSTLARALPEITSEGEFFHGNGSQN